jgi:hypothetical protein
MQRLKDAGPLSRAIPPGENPQTVFEESSPSQRAKYEI